MKFRHLLVGLLLSLLAYFIDVAILVGWDRAFLNDVKFTIKSDWIPWHLIAGLPPTITFYFSITWFTARFDLLSKNYLTYGLAALVLFWRLVFTQTVYYITPSVADQTWYYIALLTPSLSVLAGYRCYHLVQNSRPATEKN